METSATSARRGVSEQKMVRRVVRTPGSKFDYLQSLSCPTVSQARIVRRTSKTQPPVEQVCIGLHDCVRHVRPTAPPPQQGGAEAERALGPVCLRGMRTPGGDRTPGNCSDPRKQRTPPQFVYIYVLGVLPVAVRV